MIIGITGPLCAGTDSFGEILKKEKGFAWLSYSDELREEAVKRGMEITRKNLQDLGDELRKKGGLGAISKRLIEKMIPEKDYVIGNIRNPGEVEVLKEKFGKDFVLVMINAPKHIRFDRLLSRRREKDPETFEDFTKVEERDFGANEEPHGQQHAKVFQMADHVIINDSSFENLRRKARNLLKEIKQNN